MRAALARAAIAALTVSTVLVLGGCGGESEANLVASGKEYLERKDAKSAVIQLKNAIARNPQSAEARALLGRALLETGDPVAAAVELRKAQELKAPDEQVLPDLARAMLLIGEEAKVIAQFGDLRLRDSDATADLLTTVAAAHVLGNDLDKARAALRAGLQARPMYAPAITLQARLRAADGDIDGALFLLEELLAREPDNERAGVLKGEVLWAGKQDEAGAMAAFRKVLAAKPDSFTASSMIVAMLMQQGKVDEAKAQHANLRRIAPNHPETLYYEAQFAFAERDYKKVREVADSILKVMPDNVRTLELAGAAEFRQRNWLQAEAMLSRALKNAPGLLLSRQMLAQVHLRTGMPNKALEVLQPVVEGADPDGNSLALAGEAYLQLGDARRSEAAFQRAAKVAPNDARVRTSVAMAQMARGNSAPAMKDLEAIAAADRGPRADLALITGHLRNNDTAAALKAIDALDKKLPDRALAPQLRGRVLLSRNDIPGATKAFETALEREANYFPAVASLAAIDLAAGKPEEARKRFEALLRANPGNHQALLSLAELAARTGAPPEEVTRLTRSAVQANPGTPATHLALINQLLGSGQTQPALVAAQAAAAALPNDLSVADALGRAQMASGDAQQALSTFRRLAAQQPTNALHQVRMADAHLLNKDRAAAGRALRQALEIQPDLLIAQRGLAMIAMMENRPQDGLVIAREMQAKHPKEAAGWALEGDVEASRRGWDAAATAYRAALQRQRSTETAVKLHNVLLSAGKTAEADRWAEQWQRENANDAAFRYYLGDVALARGQLAQAEAAYRSVLELQPGNALAMNNVAWLLVKQGKPGALAMAEKANSLLPDRAPLLDTLASALAAEKQLKKAIETQKRAISRNPQDASLKLNLAKLFLQDNQKPEARAELEDLARLGDRFPAQAEVAALLKTL
jgi:putative PEP-CTERM system TPR-repeat lipoprotein